MKIDFAGVNAVDLSELRGHVEWQATHKGFFGLEAGKEHYKLLAWLSHNIDGERTLYDMGTLYGFSALALSANPRHVVVTCDLQDLVPAEVQTYKARPNITFAKKSCTDADVLDAAAKSAVVVLDVDPHDGVTETQVVSMLEKRNFKGLLVCDDIKLNHSMQYFWNRVKQPKWDVTHLGHWSGTGLVCFDPDTAASIVIESPSQLLSGDIQIPQDFIASSTSFDGYSYVAAS